MTPEEALAKAKEIVGEVSEETNPNGTISLHIEGDVEGVHIELDKLLCAVLKRHGYTKLVKFYQKLELWYS